MSRALLFTAAVLGGCSKDNAELDCDRYANRMVEVLGADPSRAETVRQGARMSCENGRVSATEYHCSMSARDENAVRVCQGLQPIPTEAP